MDFIVADMPQVASLHVIIKPYETWIWAETKDATIQGPKFLPCGPLHVGERRWRFLLTIDFHIKGNIYTCKVM
jgi:hypothetical protein